MIAIAVALPAASIAARPFAPPSFAPPLAQPIRYRTLDVRAVRGGEVRVVLDETLTFADTAAGIVATTVATGETVDAPEPYRGMFTAVLAPFRGCPTRVAVDRTGATGAVIDGATTWARVRAAEAAMVAQIRRNPAISPQRKAGIAAMIASEFDLPPERRDVRLAQTVALLLPPALPPLAVGETRAFTAMLSSPAGQLPSGGTVTLVSATSAALRYRVELATDPAATEQAVAALLATVTSGASPAERAGRAAAAAALQGTAYLERSDIAIDRATGLLLSTRIERLSRAADGTLAPIRTTNLDRQP